MSYEDDRLETPILLLVFNRIDTVKLVLNEIRKVMPKKLYIASDGPRKKIPNEKDKIEKVRDYLVKHVDWTCDVKTLLKEENLGCKYAVSNAITWFFENEDMGIILEDDCIVDVSFFQFCKELLNRYENDERIGQICAFNPLGKIENRDDSYLYSKFGPCWGWASWKRAWKNYDVEMSVWPKIKSEGYVKVFTDSDKELKWRLKLFESMYKREIDTWDYQWSFTKLINSQLSIVPNRNLVKNIGFGEDATHTKVKRNDDFDIVYSIGEIKHPEFVLRDKVFEDEYLRRFVSVKKQSILKKILRRILNGK